MFTYSFCFEPIMVVLLSRLLHYQGRYWMSNHNRDLRQTVVFEYACCTQYRKLLNRLQSVVYTKLVDIYTFHILNFKLRQAFESISKMIQHFSPAFSTIWKSKPSEQLLVFFYLLCRYSIISSYGYINCTPLGFSCVEDDCISFSVLINSFCLKVIILDYLWFSFFFDYSQQYAIVPFFAHHVTLFIVHKCQ